MGILTPDIKDFLVTALALLFVIIPHEIAHGYASYFLGDSTAKDDGRLSLNPLNHIDPLGLLAMIIFRFGWAKAVPIDMSKIKGNKNRGLFIISIAGVATNFILAFIFAIIFAYLMIKNSSYELLNRFVMMVMWYNVMLGVFNLVPLPPLDGSKILLSFMPDDNKYLVYKYERYFNIALFILVISGLVSSIISPIIMSIVNFFFNIGVKIWVTILV